MSIFNLFIEFACFSNQFDTSITKTDGNKFIDSFVCSW